MTAPGELNRRVLLERPSIVDDGMQRRPDGWVPFAGRWAKHMPARGREAREALGTDAQSSATFIIRRSRDVLELSEGYRLRYPAREDGQVFDIKSVVPIEDDEYLEITATTAASLSGE